MILQKLTMDDAKFFRELHIKLRASYRTNEAAQILAAKLASTDLLRHHIIAKISQLGQTSSAQ